MMPTMNSVREKIGSGLLLLAMCFIAVIGSVRAQESPAPVPPPQQEQSPSRESKAKDAKGPGFGRTLTHETREAAGEETDDKAQFKNSPSVRFLARITGLSTETAYLLSVLLNFTVIFGILFWVARKHLPGAFRERSAAIQKSMQEAQKASEEARRKLAEIESRLMKLDVEIGMMRDAAEKDAAAEEARIHAATQEDARKLVASAQQEIAAAAKSARRDLMAYAAELAVALAKKQIHVDPATDQSLVRNFAGQLGSFGGAADNPGKDGR